ncbi:hypothetical protein H257_16517 [Aphanomyces astaci]|uniref:Uncharacterized protein n=1 Tax=Aphanomyces astaci TaxID=112090 RepID=W4FKN5_APHAT|nr:hypothetical protein H257_16517 [Aphanomyces astaci]ETV67283.1 hypothetical protein H257_16517 [Aphanomyces astaci]|eukprot:XP_009843271.1 hypothetical protein H257_16517 [Aphanomyces astaci]
MDRLRPQSTVNVRAAGIKAFNKFLSSESVDPDYVKSCIRKDLTGQCFAAVKEKFALYLAACEKSPGIQLSKNSCMQYFRQVKMTLLDEFPQLQAIVDSKLLRAGKILQNYCAKKDGGAYLKRMLMYLYSTATCSSHYQDAALLSLLWYLFGRASDLAMTSEEQGLSLYPDTDFATCTLLAIALATVAQNGPCANIVDNLPSQASSVKHELGPTTPLLDVLDNPSAINVDDKAQASKSVPTIHSHVNRILGRISAAAGVDQRLSSHSFRRGGAQHANGSEQLTARWIFDRGAWNILATNKGFNYIFNTSSEDHKVAKYLSGWSTMEPVMVLTLDSFDAHTQGMGFVMEEGSSTYLDVVVSIGSAAESALFAFLREQGCHSTGSSAVLKVLQKLHRDGALKSRIGHYLQLRIAGLTTDPAPLHTQVVLDHSESTEFSFII